MYIECKYTIMLRNQLNPEITKLIREHDRTPYENASRRNAIKRQILFLMESVKLDEQFSYA